MLVLSFDYLNSHWNYDKLNPIRKSRETDIHASKTIKSLLARVRSVKWMRNFLAIFQKVETYGSLEKFCFRDE